jgi:hypothetical protein
MGPLRSEKTCCRTTVGIELVSAREGHCLPGDNHEAVGHSDHFGPSCYHPLTRKIAMRKRSKAITDTVNPMTMTDLST